MLKKILNFAVIALISFSAHAVIQGDIYTHEDMPETYAAIADGIGYFCVRPEKDDTTPLEFTRKGDFSSQEDGTLMNSSRQYLCGINFNYDGTPPEYELDTQHLKILRAPKTTSALFPTENITLMMRLPPLGETASMAFFDSTIIDSLGIMHNATFALTKQKTPNSWNLTEVTLYNGGAILVNAPNIPITFDGSGAIQTINGAGVAGSPANIPLVFDFSVNGAFGHQCVNINCGSFACPTGLTQNGDSLDAIVFSIEQDGEHPSDSIANGISEEGFLHTRFETSPRLLNRGRVVLAVFDEDHNDFELNFPYDANAGRLVPYHLEYIIPESKTKGT